MSSEQQEALGIISQLENVDLRNYRVVGRIVRYEQSTRNSMKDVKQRIVSSLSSPSFGCDNYLIWAPPGSGKSFFVQEIARSMDDLILYRELNLAQMDEQDFRTAISEIERLDKPRLCFIDEVDSKSKEQWPYETLLPSLEPPSNRKTVRTCFILAGSSGNSLSGMKENMIKRSKGIDLLSRIPSGNECVIEGLGLGDRILVASTQFLNAATEYGRRIDEVEKLVLYYVVLNPKLKSARQIRQFAIRCIERMPPGEERVKYDYLFDAGDPENKEFWNQAQAQMNRLSNLFVSIQENDRYRPTKPSRDFLRPNKTSADKDLSFQLDKHRIAVLPFANISPDPNDQYFADGTTEEIISTLSKISGLQVIARTSVIRYKNSSEGVEEIGKQLKVGSILEGSVRKAGDKLRITAQLIDSQSSHHLWSESYDRDLKDVFAIQSEISQSVAASLRIKLLEGEKLRIQKQPTKSSEAYLLYLKGLHYQVNDWTEPGLKKAIAYFEKCVAIDLYYAAAYAGISDCYDTLGNFSLVPRKEAFAKAEYFARKALDIDSSSAEAHYALSNSKARKHDLEGAEVELEKAIELNNNLALCRGTHAGYLMLKGNVDAAIKEGKATLELDPFSNYANTFYSMLLYRARRYDEAEAQLLKMIELDLDKDTAYWGLGLINYVKSDFAKALINYEKAVGNSEGFENLRRRSFVASAYAKLGRADEARKILKDMLASTKNKEGVFWGIFFIYLALGEFDVAFQYLESSDVEDFGNFATILLDPICDVIRDDPRFVALLKKYRLELSNHTTQS